MRPLGRIPGAELMDRPDVEPEALTQGLADLRRVNRWLGGTRAALSAVMPLVEEVDAARVRVLDVATGSADIPVQLARRARREGLGIDVLATDLHPETVAAARRNVAGEPDVEAAAADALALQFPSGEFHIAMCHTALHHFEPPEAGRLLAELGRVASHAVVVTDLARSRLGVAGVALMAHTVWSGHPVTRHDSMVSIRAAYTALEALELARKAGLPRPTTRSHPLFRFSLSSRLGRSSR